MNEWHDPYAAVVKFGDRCWLQRREEAYVKSSQKHREMRGIFEKTPLEYSKQYEALKQETERETEAIMRILLEDLQGKLLRGELVARGFRAPFSHGAPYLIIPRREWCLLEVKPNDRCASGGGISYVGLTIGKAGTKRFFSRNR